MKEREEYLIEFENKLLTVLERLYKTVNRDLMTAYGLAFLVGLSFFGIIPEFSYSGATLKRTDILLFMPIFISILYILTNYNLLRIADVFSQINLNSIEMKSLNNESKPITIINIHLFGSGITGLILSLSRWQARSLLRKNPFKIEITTDKTESQVKGKTTEPPVEGNTAERPVEGNTAERPVESKTTKPPVEGKIKDLSFKNILDLIEIFFLIILAVFQWLHGLLIWALYGLLRVIFIVALLFMPIILMGYFLYIEFYYQKPIKFLDLSLPYVIIIFLIVISISTIICGLKLFASYLIDLIEAFIKEFDESTSELKNIYNLTTEKIRSITKFIKFIKNILTHLQN